MRTKTVPCWLMSEMRASRAPEQDSTHPVRGRGIIRPEESPAMRTCNLAAFVVFVAALATACAARYAPAEAVAEVVSAGESFDCATRFLNENGYTIATAE